ncbi:MAG: TolC family protein [Planctomycetota bacterium]
MSDPSYRSVAIVPPPRFIAVLFLALAAAGCRTTGNQFRSHSGPASVAKAAESYAVQPAAYQPAAEGAKAGDDSSTLIDDSRRLPAPDDETTNAQAGAANRPPEVLPPEVSTPAMELKLDAAPTLPQVVASVRDHFPLIRQAFAARTIASGEELSAYGAFDRKVDGFSNVQPLDFYENHWYKLGVKRDTMWGGQVGAGYKLGRGSFEPWYRERETNDLGELSLSLRAPIIRDRLIDANRAELWRAQLERGRVEPEIRAEVIQAVREGSIAYWDWVAAGANLDIARGVLQLGLDRVDLLQRQFEEGEKAQIDLVDNQRIIVTRRAKVIDAERKLEQTAVKLALYLREPTGRPMRPNPEASPPDFPAIGAVDAALLADDIEYAQATRPELAELSIIRRQLDVAFRQARNEVLPDVDGGLFFGQDIGNPTSSDDKSELEIEVTMMLSVPLERRKALGKIRQLRGKLAQLRAKTQFASEKIATEVQVARAALQAAALRYEQTSEGVRLAERMQAAELRAYQEGQSTLFNLNLREKQTAEAAAERVAAQRDYFVALADYLASLGVDGGTLDAVIAEPAPIEP